MPEHSEAETTTESVAIDDALDALVERIRRATFEHPKAQSHSEWSQRIKAMFRPVGWVPGPMRGEQFPVGLTRHPLYDNDLVVLVVLPEETL